MESGLIQQLLADVHAVAEIYPTGSGHFVYSGGMHGDGFIDYRKLGKERKYRPLLRKLSVALIRKTISEAQLDSSQKVVVVGPETMGKTMVRMLQTAHLFSELADLTVCTHTLHKDENSLTGFQWDSDVFEVFADNPQTVLMDDLLNIGSTFKSSAQMVHAAGGTIDAIAVIGDRCNKVLFDRNAVRVTSLETFPGFSVHEPDACAMCDRNVPINRHPGHGHEFERTHPDYGGGFIDTP